MGLDTVELVMAFEEAFEIDIPNDVAEKMLTVRDVRDFVMGEYSRLGKHPDPDQIFDTIRALTVRISSADPEKIKLDTRFVDDLGLD